MLSGGTAPSAVLDASSFTKQVKKHLTELSLLLYPHEAQCLGNVGMLTTLQRLDLLPMTPRWCGRAVRDLGGQELDLKLPHLTSLRLLKMGGLS